MGTKLDDNIARGRRIGPALNLHGQRQVNGADAKDLTDLVTLRQLRTELANIKPGAPGTTNTTNITNNNTYNGTGPWFDDGTGTVFTLLQSDGFKHKMTLSGNTLVSFSGFTDGDEVLLWFIDATGGRLLTLGFPTRYHTGAMPDVANVEMFMKLVHDGTGMVELYATSYF